MNPGPAMGEPALQGSWGRWGLKHVTHALTATDGSGPNLSDGRLYEPGGTERAARPGPDRLKQHKTAPGWGGPGTVGPARSGGSEESRLPRSARTRARSNATGTSGCSVRRILYRIRAFTAR